MSGSQREGSEEAARRLHEVMAELYPNPGEAKARLAEMAAREALGMFRAEPGNADIRTSGTLADRSYPVIPGSLLTGAFAPHMLPPSMSLSGGAPEDAPPGTIFAMSDQGGWAVPPRKFTLLFGRDREDVHVPVGVDDPAVSGRQGVFTCRGPGGGWWLRNSGNLPIELPDGALLLAGHQRPVAPGYTPLVINSSRQRSHLLEVRVVGEPGRQPQSTTKAENADPETVYELSAPERLVLTALARRYLEGHDDYPLPLTWKETARVANSSPYATRVWNSRTVAYTVEDVRMRLHRLGVRGLLREEVGQPVGPTLSVNLIRELLKTATIDTQDLALLPKNE